MPDASRPASRRAPPVQIVLAIWNVAVYAAWIVLPFVAALHRELPGYVDYARRVRYRLLPGVW